MWGKHQAAAESYLDWWHLAGVDAQFSDAPAGFLDPATPDLPSDETLPPARTSQATPLSAPPIPSTPPQPMPDTLAAFQQWWMTAVNAPGAQGLTARVAPQGETGAALMLLADFPDPDDAPAGGLFAGDQGALLAAMLSAASLASAPPYVASLLASRPPGGVISARDIEPARLAALHHIGLVRPEMLLIFGENVAAALGAKIDAETDLRSLNLNGRITPIWVLPHPRQLLMRPEAKRAAWQTLKAARAAMRKGAAHAGQS